MKKTVDRDPIRGLQAAVIINLRADARVLRKEQRRRERDNLGPDRELVEMVSNNARAAASVCSEVRKSGKDMRDQGKGFGHGEAADAFAAYLRSLPSSKRSEAIQKLQAAVSDG